MNAQAPLSRFHRQTLDGVWKAVWFDGQRGGDGTYRFGSYRLKIIQSDFDVAEQSKVPIDAVAASRFTPPCASVIRCHKSNFLSV